MSSLSQQLKAIGDRNASLALDRKSRSRIHSKSLIFEPKVAATQDYSYLYDIGRTGLEDLCKIDSRFSKFFNSVFSETSVDFDRNTETEETLHFLNANIEAFLNLAAPYYSLAPTIKAIEWLVRRYYINIHNSESLLLSALPYYKYPIFSRMLYIIPKNSFPKLFEGLLNYKDGSRTPQASSILKIFSDSPELFQLYVSYFAQQIKNSCIYEKQIIFYVSNTIQLIASMTKDEKTFNEKYLGQIIESIYHMLRDDNKSSPAIGKDIILSAYSIVAVLASSFNLSTDLVHALSLSISEKGSNYSILKQKIIVLGHLWKHYKGDDYGNYFSNLSLEDSVNQRIIDELIAEDYEIGAFLICYFLSTPVKPITIHSLSKLSEMDYKIYFKKIIAKLSEYIFGDNFILDDSLVPLIKTLISINEIEFSKFLSSKYNTSLSQLEIKLQRSFINPELIEESASNLSEDYMLEDKDNLTIEQQDITYKFRELLSTSKSYLVQGNSDEFQNLTESLLEILSKANLRYYKIYIAKFSSEVFPNPLVSLTFFLRLSFTPIVPLKVRILCLQFVNRRFKEICLSGNDMDAYVIVPLVLLGLYDDCRSLRRAYLELLFTIDNITRKLHSDKKKKKATLLLEDQIYGDLKNASRAIISPNDSLLLFEDLESCKDEVITEIELSKTRVLHFVFEQLFKMGKIEGKKNVSKNMGQLVLKTFIVNQWALRTLPFVVQTKVWDILSDCSHSIGQVEEAKNIISDMIESYSSNRKIFKEEAKLAGIDFESAEQNLVSLINAQTMEEINWLLLALDYSSSLSRVVGRQIEKVFQNTKCEFKIAIFNKLLDMLCKANEESAADFCDPLEILQSLKYDKDVFNSVLSSIQISRGVPEQLSTKRRRRSSNSAKQAMAREDINNMASMHLKRLTVVLDVLFINLNKAENDVNTESLQLLFQLLTDLDYLGQDGNLPVFYAQETLASCILLTIKKLEISYTKEEIRFDSNFIRADIIVNSIRSSESPQIQNKLLLVIAELANIAPEIVLHSVMPIFTFMGAYTVRQDNEYSAWIIQETIAKVIPSLASASDVTLSHEIEFLLASFVAAFMHIPRHRRVTLFSSLCKTLGPDKSIFIVLFLIGKKYSENYFEGSVHDNSSLLEFVTSFLTYFSPKDQLNGISEFMTLWEQIPNHALKEDSAEFEKLNKRPVFESQILTMSDESLVNLKTELLVFMNKILLHTNNETNNLKSLKFKIYLILLDSNVSEEEKKSILISFRKFSSFVISSLDQFSKSTHTGLLESLYDILKSTMDLLPLKHFINSLLELFDTDKISSEYEVNMAKNLSNIISLKLKSDVDFSLSKEEIEDIIIAKFFQLLKKGLQSNIDSELQQAYYNTLASTISTIGKSPPVLTNAKFVTAVLDVLKVTVSDCGLLSDKLEVLISSINIMCVIVELFGVKTIGLYPKIVPPLLEIWKNASSLEDEEARILQTSIILLFSCYFKKMPTFVVPNLSQIISVVILSDSVDVNTRQNVLDLAIDHLEAGDMLKALFEIWRESSLYANSNTNTLGLYMKTLSNSINALDKKTAVTNSAGFMQWLIRAFEFRFLAEKEERFDNNSLFRLENSFHSCSVEYVMKLNDKSFRPVFASMVRWALSGEGSSSSEIEEQHRLLAFFRFFNKLQEGLKSIITSYFSYLTDPVSDILKRFISGDIVNVNLRRLILSSLTSSFKYDQDDYWSQQSRFDAICLPLIDQLQNIEPSIGKYLVKAITAFIVNISSEDFNETLVNSLIKHISNETPGMNVNSKIWTIRCLKSIFHKLGEQWLSYLPTFIPYIAELLEDDDEDVEMEVRNGLVRVIENVLGEPLDRYLD